MQARPALPAPGGALCGPSSCAESAPQDCSEAWGSPCCWSSPSVISPEYKRHRRRVENKLVLLQRAGVDLRVALAGENPCGVAGRAACE